MSSNFHNTIDLSARTAAGHDTPRRLATALAIAAFAAAAPGAAQADPLRTLFGAVFGQQPPHYQQPQHYQPPQHDQQPQHHAVSRYHEPATSQAYAYASPDYPYGSGGNYMAGARIPRELVSYGGPYAPGTVVISTSERRLYLILPGRQALRYGIGVGREGFEWAGSETITRKEEWPSWTPPAQMLRRRPDLPRFMEGGPDNPLGARALYLGGTLYRIHGSNEPDTIGQAVSSGCIRMLNEDVIDLYERVRIGTRVVVLR
jgi:lipoprotein-anchoring transpeptidase ErfK/SrfK